MCSIANLFNASEHLSADLKDIIADITPHIEERLRNHAIQSGERFQMRNRQQVKFDNVFVSEKSLQLYLTDIEMIKYPDFRLTVLEINFERLYIKVKLDLNKLCIVGNHDYFLSNLMPLKGCGKITYDMEGLTLEGIVGLSVVEDSFITQNYYFNFTREKINTNVEDVEGCTTKPSILTNDIDSEKLLSSLWNDIIDYLITAILNYQIGENLIDYSYRETLTDEDNIVDEYRKYAVNQSEKANKIFDLLLSNVIKELSNTKQLAIDDICKNDLDMRLKGKFQATDGRIGDLSKLILQRNCNMYEIDDTLFLIGKINFDELKCVFDKYVISKTEDIDENTGNITMTLCKNMQMLVKVSLNKSNGCMLNLDDIQITNVRSVDFNATNLSPIYVDNLILLLTGHLKYNIIKNVKEIISEAFVVTFKCIDLNELTN